MNLRGSTLGARRKSAAFGLALFLALAGASAFAPARSDAVCGPFGNPPAKVIAGIKPDCGSGARLGPWRDAERVSRYACLYEPPSASRDHKLPMVVFLHPSLFPAGSVRQTDLLEAARTFQLNGDPNSPGFIVLAPEGRKTSHFYPIPDRTGIGWDNWYRQLTPTGEVTVGGVTYRENVDAAAIDHFVAREIATGKVDTSRIYLTGWSNGSAMAILYGLNRHNIAAIAVYSAPNPFGAFDDPCAQTPVAGIPEGDGQIRIFNPGVPTMHVHNACDLAGICPNGEEMARELRGAGVEVRDIIVNSDGQQVDACAGYCGTDPMGESWWRDPIGYVLGLYHHLQWPIGWTAAMLEFMRTHPLKPAK